MYNTCMDADKHIVIRVAHDHDFPHLWPLLEAMGKTDAHTAVQDRFITTIHSSAFFLPLALVNDVIVGYAWTQDYGPHLRTGRRIARLHDLYVAPAWRHYGIGTRLFQAIRDWCDQHAIAWLQWQASQVAVPFYTRLGLRGDPCPDPTHPFYEIAFAAAC